jgi:methionyl-tRNA formyltransferase
MNSPRVIFMGTPGFAVGTLDALVSAGIEVAAVVTAPDKPAGRGRQLRMSAVKERAVELGLPVLQPERLRDPAFLAELDRIAASLYVVVAFRMLPEVVWTKPGLGTVNLHASLLPQYRGAAPINWALINGEVRTGVTTFLISHEIDTGDLLLQEAVDITPDMNAGDLHDELMRVGAALMVRTVQGLHKGELKGTPQHVPSTGMLRNAPKIHPGDLLLDPAWTAQRMHDHVRGMSPFPGPWLRLQLDERPHIQFKVLRTRMAEESVDVSPGTVHLAKGQMLLACADRWIELLEVQPEGKRRMSADEFMRGLQQVKRIYMTAGKIV